jgi:Ca2+-binding RTX toxin-like protein
MAQTPSSWLPKTTANVDTTGLQSQQQIIGLSNGNILVVWADDSPSAASPGRDISAVIYDAEGNVVRSAFQLNDVWTANNEGRPSIAATSDGGFVMAYEENSGSGTSLRIEMYYPNGNLHIGTTLLVDPGDELIGNPKIAVSPTDGSIFVTYEYDDGNNESVRARLFNSNLDPIGPERIIRNDEDLTNTEGDGNPRRQDTAALTGGGYVTVFEESDITNAQSDTGIEVVLTNADGTNALNIPVTAGNGVTDSNPRIAALSDGGFVVTWVEWEQAGGIANNNIMFRIFNANGFARTDVMAAADNGNNMLTPDVVGLEDGTFFIVWKDNATNSIEGRLFDGTDGSQIGDEIIVDTQGIPANPELGTSTDGRILITYQTLDGGDDVHYQILDPRGSTIDADSGDGQVTGGLMASTINGSAANDILLGQGAADVINAASGDDVVYGGGGADTINGGAGNDTMSGGTGGDTYNNVELNDLILELPGGGYDIVNTAQATYKLGANMERVNYTGAGNFVGTGNSLDNRFSGNVGNDRFIDTFGGADIFSGGLGTDTVDFRTANEGAVINFVTGVMGGSALGDTFASIEVFWGSNTAADNMQALNGNMKFYGFGGNDTLQGGTGMDVLSGGAGNDSLSGGGNVDNLLGGTGNDTLTGGNQADLFVYVEANFGADVVTDFTDGSDRLKVFSAVANDISDFNITGNGTTSVMLTLATDPNQSITLNGPAAITITATDFVFY